MALTVTPGDAAADSYATLVEFDAYHLIRTPGLVWAVTTATDPQKENALRIAANLLDAIFQWTGAPVDDVQRLTWPRGNMLTRNGFEILTTVVPQELKDAQSEWAGLLGTSDLFSAGGGGTSAQQQNVAGVKAGSVDVKFGALNEETVDLTLRLKSPEFAWSADSVPQTVRTILVASWWTQTLVDPAGIIFGVM